VPVPDIDSLRYRKQLQTERAFYWTVIVSLLVALGTIVFSDKPCSIQVGEELVAWVDGIKTAENVINTLRDEYVGPITKKYGKRIAGTFRFKKSPSITRRSVEGPRIISEQEALKRLRAAVTPQVKGWVVYIAKTPLVGLPTKKMAEETIYGVKLKLTGGNRAEANKRQLQGGSKVDEDYIDLEDMRPKPEEAVAYLTKDMSYGSAGGGTSSTGTDDGNYTVQPGDTGMAIARKFNTTVQALEEVNRKVEWQKLKPGDKLRVPATGNSEPPAAPPSNASSSPRTHGKPESSNIAITNTKVEKVRESIPYATIKRHSLKLNPGQTEIRRKGEKGVRDVQYKVYYQNGKAIKREETGSEIIKQPIAQEVLYGSEG